MVLKLFPLWWFQAVNSAQCDAINKNALVAGRVNTGREGG